MTPQLQRQFDLMTPHQKRQLEIDLMTHQQKLNIDLMTPQQKRQLGIDLMTPQQKRQLEKEYDRMVQSVSTIPELKKYLDQVYPTKVVKKTVQFNPERSILYRLLIFILCCLMAAGKKG